jgi:hypothetical protein
MTSYRGIDKEALIDSLRRAEVFLRRCDLGPATTRSLDSWLENAKPFEKLERAADNDVLAWAMNATFTSFLFHRFQEVFEHHAMVSFQEHRPDSEAMTLYRDLSAWNAFEGNKFYEEIAGEVADHIILDCFRLLGERGVKSLALEENMNMRALARSYPGTAEWLDDAVPVLSLLSVAGNREGALELLKGEDVTDKAALKDILYEKTGLADAGAALEVPHALKHFAIMPVKARNVPFDTESDLFKFLEPYTRTHEVDLRAVSLMDDGRQNTGVSFRATTRVANEVASAFRSAGFRLIDYEDDADSPGPSFSGFTPGPSP